MTGISAQGDSLVWLTNVIIVGSTHALSASSENQVESAALIHVDGSNRRPTLFIYVSLLQSDTS